MKNNWLFKTIVPTIMLSSIAVFDAQLGLASSSQIVPNDLLINKTSNNVHSNKNDDDVTRYVVVDNHETETDVVSSPQQFSASEQASNLRFELRANDSHVYYVSNIEKVVMRGENLTLGTDYEVLNTDDGDGKIVHLLDSELTSTLFTIYIFPQLAAKIFNYEIQGQSQDVEGGWVDNNEIADLQLFGDISYVESFVVRVKIKIEKWLLCWIFVEDTPVIVKSGDRTLTRGVDFEYEIIPSSQYLDITIYEHVATDDITVIPCLKNSGKEPITGIYNLNIYAEGVLLETREKCITRNSQPKFILSLASIDADRKRQFDVYQDSCKVLNESHVKQTVPFTYDKEKHEITLDFTGIGVSGDAELNIDIQLRSGSNSPFDTFNKDSWKEIDMLEQFFGSDTDAFARAYQLEHLSQFVENKFQKTIDYYEDYNLNMTFTVVSVNQMPIAANDETITEASDRNAYFTFMSSERLAYNPNSPHDEDIGDCYYEEVEFESYVATYDHNANCWYRREDDKPASHGCSSVIRNYLKNKFTKAISTWRNNNLISYIKHIANRTVIKSAGVKSGSGIYEQAFVNDMFFIPTARQLGFAYHPFGNFKYMFEDDNNGDRVFQAYQGKEYSEQGDPELKRYFKYRSSSYLLNTSGDYWLATPASNDSGISIEDVAYISKNGKLGRKDYDTNKVGVLPCFCL